MSAVTETMPKSNPAFVLKGINDVGFEERPMPDPSTLDPYEALVAVKATGICGSDIHYWKHGSIGKYVLKDKMILGHESSGIISAVGSGVRDLKAGDKVAMEPGECCGRCAYCKEGRYFLCEDMKFAATPPFDGTLASYYKLPANLCYKLPDTTPLDEGALVEPLSVAVHALTNVARLQPNQNILIFGAGPVGLLCMAAAKAMGARRIIASDINDERLAFAKKYAAHEVFKPSPRAADENDNITHAQRLSKELLAQTGMDEAGLNGIDAVVDCSGAEICLQTGICAAKPGGVIAAVGMGKENIVLPIGVILGKALELRGSFRYGPGVFQKAVDFVAQGKVDLKPLITHTFSFDRAEDAYITIAEQKGPDGKMPIKAVIGGPAV